MEILIMISAIAASSVMVALWLLAPPGFIVSPQKVDTPAPKSTREEELLCQIGEVDQRLSQSFWRRYDQLVAKRKEETLVPDSPEHRELVHMTNEMECRHAERLVLL